MKKIKKRILISLFIFFIIQNLSNAQNSDNLLVPIKNYELKTQTKTNSVNSFSLANIVDSFLNTNNKDAQLNSTDKKAVLRKKFIDITSKFNQGNALVAYDEYQELINEVEDDISLLSLAKVFYEIGYFSLANKAIEKIVYKNQYFDNINDLEKSYRIKAELTKEQEIYFAKLYSNIYFDNSATETITELVSKKNEFNKNDYALFMLSQSYFEIKKYSEALSLINKVINLNSNNINYQMFKLDILIAQKKYKEALHLVLKLENSKILTPYFVDELEIRKQIALTYKNKKEKDRKYNIVYQTYLEGNYEKTKKDCQNILNFDKNNYKILALYAKSELALGNIERANSYFVNSYKINKSNLDTKIGVADIKYLHGDYKNAIKTYKKALKEDKNNYEIIIKLADTLRQAGLYPKELKKLEIKLDNIPRNSFNSYYDSAISFAQKNTVLKEALLKKALEVNPTNEKVLGALVELHLKNKNYKIARELIYCASFTLKKNYYYYYLCGLYNQAINKNKDAVQFYKTSLNLNPNFEIANSKLLKLIPNALDEEI